MVFTNAAHAPAIEVYEKFDEYRRDNENNKNYRVWESERVSPVINPAYQEQHISIPVAIPLPSYPLSHPIPIFIPSGRYMPCHRHLTAPSGRYMIPKPEPRPYSRR